MKAKYGPCLGVKLGAVDRGDIGDFGLVGLEPGGIDEGILVRKHIEKPCGIGGSFCALGHHRNDFIMSIGFELRA